MGFFEELSEENQDFVAWLKAAGLVHRTNELRFVVEVGEVTVDAMYERSNGFDLFVGSLSVFGEDFCLTADQVVVVVRWLLDKERGFVDSVITEYELGNRERMLRERVVRGTGITPARR